VQDQHDPGLRFASFLDQEQAVFLLQGIEKRCEAEDAAVGRLSYWPHRVLGKCKTLVRAIGG